MPILLSVSRIYFAFSGTLTYGRIPVANRTMMTKTMTMRIIQLLWIGDMRGRVADTQLENRMRHNEPTGE